MLTDTSWLNLLDEEGENNSRVSIEGTKTLIKISDIVNDKRKREHPKISNVSLIISIFSVAIVIGTVIGMVRGVTMLNHSSPVLSPPSIVTVEQKTIEVTTIYEPAPMVVRYQHPTTTMSHRFIISHTTKNKIPSSVYAQPSMTTIPSSSIPSSSTISPPTSSTPELKNSNTN